MRRARRSAPHEHLADLAQGHPLAPHHPRADQLEEVVHELLCLFPCQTAFVSDVANHRGAGEFLGHLHYGLFCRCFCHCLPLPLEHSGAAYGRVYSFHTTTVRGECL
jgi:hypothetical protein